MFKYIVFPGNNSILIKESLDKRGSWSEASEEEAKDLIAHFIWKPTTLSVRVFFT